MLKASLLFPFLFGKTGSTIGLLGIGGDELQEILVAAAHTLDLDEDLSPCLLGRLVNGIGLLVASRAIEELLFRCQGKGLPAGGAELFPNPEGGGLVLLHQHPVLLGLRAFVFGGFDLRINGIGHYGCPGCSE